MTALIFTGLAIAVGLLIALFGALTARRDGSFGWPRWPARYPAARHQVTPARSALARKARRRRIYGDMRARAAAIALAVAGPVTEAEWDAAARRAGWRPGSEDEEAWT